MKRIAILSLFVLALPSVTQAHHIRGIPHYSYQDHYPETPVYEVDQVVDAYDVTFTYYEIPGQMALDLAMYIRDTLPEPTPYEGPVNFLVWGRHEDPDQTHPFTAFRNATNVYKVGWVYEDVGAYYVRIVFSDDQGEHRAVFDLSVGESSRTWTYLGGSVALVVMAAAATGIIRKKRRRSPRTSS